MNGNFFGGQFFGGGFFGALVTDTKVGGDDVPRRRKSPHRGFDLDAWKASQPDFEGTIRRAYSELTRGPLQAEARELVEPYIQANEIDWEALARDTEAVEELIRLREEEEVVMIFLLH